MIGCERCSARAERRSIDEHLPMARPVQKRSTMPSTKFLSILSLSVACALAGCAEKETSQPAAKTAANGGGESGGGVTDDSKPSTRNGTLPPRPRHLGNGGDDRARADGEDPQRPSREEMMAKRDERRQEMIDQFDTDKDGKLSEVERETMHTARVTEMMGKIDSDHDGKLSKAELEAAPMRGRRGGPDFDRLDADKDGFVSATEMAAMRPPRGGRGLGGPGGPGGDDQAPPADK